MKSSNAVLPFPRTPARRREQELAFLPAALEIVETPPSPIGRAIGATIIAFFVLAVAWACLGTVDIVATAPGKIAPTGRTKVVQPVAIGVVRAIHVHDGQTVKKGDLLIELDPTADRAEEAHSKSDLLAARLDVARLKAALGDSTDPLAAFAAPPEASAALLAAQRQLLLTQATEQRAKLAGLNREAAQKEAERATAAAEIGKIEALIPLLRQQVDMRKTLFQHETGSKLAYLQTLQQLVEAEQGLVVQKSRYHEADAALSVIAETRAQASAEYRRKLLDDLTKAEAKAAGLAQDLIKAEQRTRLQQLRAPVDGVVQQLAVHTVGGVVTPAQPLLVVVPLASRLEIEAMVSNRDVGFIKPGQEAEIKVATFNFTRYGLLHGRVESVSHDAVEPDRGSPGKEQGAGEGNTPEHAKEPAYAARISLPQSQMKIDGRLVDLTPGMAVTVEIKTGERRIIRYLLSPLRRYEQDSLRER
jgi:hemolysin D